MCVYCVDMWVGTGAKDMEELVDRYGKRLTE